jgi:tetratricopeptide (TPR) repeat protein
VIDRRYRTGDGVIVVAVLGLLFFTFREYRGFTSISGPVELVSASSPIAAAARIESTKAYLLTHPEDFNAWADLAIACYQKGPDAYAEGLNALDKARKLGATGDALFWYAGVMFQGLGLPEYAISELERYRRHYPDQRETRARLANLYLQEKRTDDAWALYENLRKENPKDPVILYNYAVVAKEKGKWEEAYGALAALHQDGQPFPEADAALEKEINAHRDGIVGKKP